MPTVVKVVYRERWWPRDSAMDSPRISRPCSDRGGGQTPKKKTEIKDSGMADETRGSTPSLGGEVSATSSSENSTKQKDTFWYDISVHRPRWGLGLNWHLVRFPPVSEWRWDTKVCPEYVHGQQGIKQGRLTSPASSLAGGAVLLTDGSPGEATNNVMEQRRCGLRHQTEDAKVQHTRPRFPDAQPDFLRATALNRLRAGVSAKTGNYLRAHACLHALCRTRGSTDSLCHCRRLRGWPREPPRKQVDGSDLCCMTHAAAPLVLLYLTKLSMFRALYLRKGFLQLRTNPSWKSVTQQLATTRFVISRTAGLLSPMLD